MTQHHHTEDAAAHKRQSAPINFNYFCPKPRNVRLVHAFLCQHSVCPPVEQPSSTSSLGRSRKKTTRIAMLHTLLEKLPLSQGGKVAFGTLLCLGICWIPVSRKTKAGHDLFSSEKPQDVYDGEVQRRREQLAQQYNQEQQK